MKILRNKTIWAVILMALVMLPAKEALSRANENADLIDYTNFKLGEKEFVYFYTPTLETESFKKMLSGYSVDERALVTNPHKNVFGSGEEALIHLISQDDVIELENGFITTLENFSNNDAFKAIKQGSIIRSHVKTDPGLISDTDKSLASPVAHGAIRATSLPALSKPLADKGRLRQAIETLMIKQSTIKNIRENAVSADRIKGAVSIIENEDGVIEFLSSHAPTKTNEISIEKKTPSASFDITYITKEIGYLSTKTLEKIRSRAAIPRPIIEQVSLSHLVWKSLTLKARLRGTRDFKVAIIPADTHKKHENDKFGLTSEPPVVDTGLVHIARAVEEPEIIRSLLDGDSMTLRGPPESLDRSTVLTNTDFLVFTRNDLNRKYRRGYSESYYQDINDSITTAIIINNNTYSSAGFNGVLYNSPIGLFFN